jgi:hypothetical protein
LISSTLAVESRHDAFFRHVQDAEPNPAPFNTGINDIWAYNLALSFIVPGSCPVEVPVPVLPKLTVAQPVTALYANNTSNLQYANPTSNLPYANNTSNLSYANSTNSAALQFSWDPAQMSFVVEEGKQLLVRWVNQINVPVYTPLSIITKGSGTASPPQGLNGVTFAILTTQRYDSVNDLSLKTLAGPVIIPVS